MRALYYIPNWLRKYLGPEDLLTIEIANYLKAKNFLFHHTYNEGKRSKTGRGKLIGFGVLTGIPDFLIFEPRGAYVGLALELKVIYADGKKNRLSKEQKQAQEDLAGKGWKTATAWTFEEFEDILKNYLAQEPRNQPTNLTT